MLQDKFNANYISQSKLYCIAGCNDAITLYFQKIQCKFNLFNIVLRYIDLSQ